MLQVRENEISVAKGMVVLRMHALEGTLTTPLPIHRKTASLSQKKHITELLHNSLQAIKYKKACFCLPILTIHIFQRI